MKNLTVIGTTRLTVLVEPPTIRRLKLLAIDERRSASSILREALNRYLDRREKNGKSDKSSTISNS